MCLRIYSPFSHTPSISATQTHCIFVIALQRNMCVSAPACSARLVRVSPGAEKSTHYKHFTSVYPGHAARSSDSSHSKVLEMPQEPALTCMRAGASLWCNCSNGEGQRPAQPVQDIKAQMWTQHLGFLAAVSVLFEDGGRLLHRQVFGNRWKSPFNFVAAKMVYALWGLTCSILLRYCVLSLDQHNCEPFIQAVRVLKSLPPACVALFTWLFCYWI